VDYGAATVEIAGTRGTASLRVMVPCSFRLMQWGLQGHRSLGAREGMMFASRNWPREEPIPMWMAKVAFELAMIWVGADGVVRDIELAAPGDPATYDHRGLYVIEANAALAPEIGILPGDATARLSWRDPCPATRRAE
jgi:uncharacterized membrane protein (UPF0127 family)